MTGRCGPRSRDRFPGWSPGGHAPLAVSPDLRAAARRAPATAPLRPTRGNASRERARGVAFVRCALAID